MARAAVLSALAILAGAQSVAVGADAKASAATTGRKGASSAAAATPSPVAAPTAFEGTLESGKSYIAEVAWDNNALHIWRPLKDVKVPAQHAWTIDWTNLAAFPGLKTPATRARTQRFQFKVNGIDVSSGSPMIPWTTIFHCEVIGIEPATGAPAPAARRK